MLSRSLPASQNGPIRTSLVPLSRPIYWPSLPADNGSEEFAVVTVESISLHSIEMVGRIFMPVAVTRVQVLMRMT
jgi:hypothetical protein